MADQPSIVFAGGGTGGHVLAGVAVADSWREKYGKYTPVMFVGAQGGIEEKLVPRAGYSLELLKLGSLNRVSIVRKLKTYFQLPFSLLRSASMLRKLKPSVVLGVGGYASGPLVLMASLMSKIGLLKASTAILEQNSVPGFTNRMLGKFVDRIFVAFPGTESQFPKNRAIVTGNPVRSTMKRLASAKREPFTVFVFGGSQGALGINTLVLDALEHLDDIKSRIRFIHQTGERDYDRVLLGHRQAGTQARVEKFIHDMPQAYGEASLLVCRAGSGTLSEIAAVGRSAILIPLPTAADNHQEKNARVFVDAGAALLLVQTRAEGKDLAQMIRYSMEHPEKLDQMEDAVTRFYRPNAAADLVDALGSLGSGVDR